jgi:CO dehydrogenase/acetyl-CoA synthase gamma subunit (corrinoid Fe-S protein)
MRAMDKYLTEAKIKLNQMSIKKLLGKPKSGAFEINDKKVQITVAGDVMIWNYPSDFFELTYILIDLSDDMGYTYQQLGMNTKKEMKFVIDVN